MIDIKELRKRLFYRADITLEVQTVEELLNRLEEAETAWKEVDKACRDLTEKVIPNLRESLEAAESKATQ